MVRQPNRSFDGWTELDRNKGTEKHSKYLIVIALTDSSDPSKSINALLQLKRGQDLPFKHQRWMN
ncbi:hypothetical protein CS542_01105 [Pedobacter sp. IW39]|nr:hypothetical protein CS542_01105 [Pedobacter sp. IW39]